MNSIHTGVESGVLSGIMLINAENLYVCIYEKSGRNEIVLYKIIFYDKTGHSNGTFGVPKLMFITWI